MERKKTPLISIQYVSKSYDEDVLNYEHLVLRNVNLEIYDGEFVVIFGPSGSGKSSLLNLIAGLEMPTAGRVMLRRRDLSHFNHDELAKYHRLKMGMVFQSFNLIKSLNVWENVALPQTANGIRYSLRHRRALRLLKLFGLDEYPERHINELSGGQQQRVAIARSLINNPFFLLVDEPTGNLDSKSAADVMKIFYGLNKHGKHTIIMVTHNPEQLQYASRVIYVQDGQIVKDERREDLNHDIDPPMPKAHLNELGEYKTELPDDHGAHPAEVTSTKVQSTASPSPTTSKPEVTIPIAANPVLATVPVQEKPVEPTPKVPQTEETKPEEAKPVQPTPVAPPSAKPEQKETHEAA